VQDGCTAGRRATGPATGFHPPVGMPTIACMEYEDQGGGMGMGERGVTRPSMGGGQPSHEQEEHDEHERDEHEQDEGEQPSSGHGGHHMMSEADRTRMLEQHHSKTQWIYWSLVLLGAWMILSPLTFGFGTGQVAPSGGRDVWLGMENRAAAMRWSDFVSGLLLMVFGWRSLRPNRPISLWICCLVGIWLTLAPVLFWAPTAAAYLNDTFVGMLVIALTVLIPGMPNMIKYMKMGQPTPPGWSYNPSSWAQRSILIALGFGGFVVSRYLAAFQLGYIDGAWDPFFGQQSEQVLNSQMSHMWPISDAAFGTVAYTFEFLMAFMGSQSRWRSMPWMVALFGILVIPLGMVHILLVISQPVVVGAWCTLCLLAAALMLPMIPLEGDEVVAMLQHLRGAKARGESRWTVFWKGGAADGCTPDDRSPEGLDLSQKPGRTLRASVWGFSVPWNLVVAAVLGLLLMITPDVLEVARPASSVFQLAGALIVASSVISMGEVFRIVRFFNLLLAGAIAVGAWVLSGASTAVGIWAVAAAAAVVLLSLPRGRITERYGSWNRVVR
jgi:hypothetical protein